MGNGFLSRSIFVVVLSGSIIPCAAAFQPHDGEPLRVRHDAPRQRTWYLVAGDGVYLQEEGGDALWRFALPGWVNTVRTQASDPDLVVEPDGSLLVSSNIVPDLWRVDADSRAVARLRVAPDQDTTKDFGFASLRIAGDGVLYAIGSIDGGGWRIDVEAGRAQRRAPQPEVARSAR